MTKHILTPIDERFWYRVNKNGPVVREELGACWVWIGGKGRDGYGLMSEGRRRPGVAAGKMLRVHRVSWELHNGPIPEGRQVCHKCDNAPCVRPSHLFLGTNKQNHEDMTQKGRHWRQNAGRGAPLRKLTDAQIKQILVDPRSARNAAPDYGVDWRTIAYVRRKNGVVLRRT